jgi:hypothetical protein
LFLLGLTASTTLSHRWNTLSWLAGVLVVRRQRLVAEVLVVY